VPLSADDKDAIRAYVEQGLTPEDKQARRRECQEIYEVSLPTIAAITAHSTIRKNKALGIKPKSTGATFDYTSPIKSGWREQLRTFIERAFPGDRSNLRALHLCGLEGHETDTLVALGLNPKNIHGVEITKDTAKLQAIRDRTGAQIHRGRIEDHVTNGPWDIISLDHAGPITTERIASLSSLNLTSKSVVATNFLAGREQAAAQRFFQANDVWVKMVQDAKNHPNVALADRDALKDSEYYTQYNEVLEGRLVPATNISETRHQFSFLLSTVMPHMTTVFRHKMVRTDLVRRTERVLDQVHQQFYPPAALLEETAIQMALQTILEPVNLTRRHEAYEYTSPSRQTFYADMFELERFDCPDPTLRAFIQALNQACATAQNLTEVASAIRTKAGFLILDPIRPQLSDTLELIFDGKIVASISARSYYRGIKYYIQHIDSDPIVQALFKARTNTNDTAQIIREEIRPRD